ncbi:MAG: DUF1800 domain-containing protein [Pseudomonadota bacterium]|nr:DUF1800 domain-containing protein [Pseudomonadota bacterium]
MRARDDVKRGRPAGDPSVRWATALMASGALLTAGGAASAASAVITAAPAPQWVKAANEWGQFTLAASTRVRFGTTNRWIEKTLTGTVKCTSTFFGSDPASGVFKRCDVKTVAAVPAAPAPSPAPAPAAPAAADATTRDAVRLATQASFGNTEALTAEIKAQGASKWIVAQMALTNSRYTSGGDGTVHKNTSQTGYCDQPAHTGPNCWRDNYSTIPLVWDFYRNATTRPDQLRQRVAFALQQIVVVSGNEADGTYGFRNYQNTLLDNAFGNYRQVLKKVALSPVMGDFLNNVNNEKSAPNENFARELLQLFAVGTCQLNADGSLRGGACAPTYDNETVRSYAYALTGWTYPAGGATPWGCWPKGTNCRYYGGDMVPVEALHDNAERKLMSSLTLAAGHKAPAALEAVLDSLIAHPNTAPFIGKQLIQQLVSSNPSAAYVGRVSAAFASGKYATFGTGQRGDLAATVAAVLLDPEARSATVIANGGKLRDPVLMFTGVLRGLNGQSDGDALSWWWGEELREHVFRPPSVFNFYPPDYPVAGTPLVGPSFGIHNANAALQRLNYLTYLLDWGGSAPSADVPNATGTKVDLMKFTADAVDAGKLVDRLSVITTGQPLPTSTRAEIIKAVSWWTVSTDKTNWQINRVKTAAYLVFATPNFQVQR